MNPRNQKSVAERFAGMRSDYEAMNESRFRRSRPGVTSAGGAADTHYASEARFIRMREYARAMVRDDAVIGFLVERVKDNTVRTGFRPEPQTGDKDGNLLLWEKFTDWAGDKRACDVGGDLTFPEMEGLVCDSVVIDGDIFPVGTDEGSLQFFEADRCRTPTNSRRNIVHGVELGPRRERLAYYFTKEVLDPFSRVARVADAPRMSAIDSDGFDQVFHVYKPNRFTQTRGVTAFHAIFDKAGMFEDIDFALLVKEQMAACLVASWESTDAYTGPMPQTGEREETELTDGSKQIEQGFTAGQVFDPPPGKKLAFHSPQVPSAETMQHLRQTMQVLALNLGLPLCVAMMDASETNFSGWRGAMDQAKLGFQRNQNILEIRFHRPVWTWKVRDWIATDKRVAALWQKVGNKIFAHKWHKPRWPYVQPLQDAMADTVRGENYLASMPDIISESGRDPDDVREETLDFNAAAILGAIKRAQKIKDETGVDVAWRDVYNRAVPKGGQILDMMEAPNKIAGEDQQQPQKQGGAGNGRRAALFG
jgi:lambda family phage portal protein